MGKKDFSLFSFVSFSPGKGIFETEEIGCLAISNFENFREEKEESTKV